tara:strand:+ start:127 stop:1131 length:1005 start_codon:yes stop_codon:yes gene_type:complete
MSVLITKAKLIEIVNQETQGVLVERYLRNEIIQLLREQEEAASFSTAKIESLLQNVISALGGIDMSIDYLTAAVTGNDPASIGIAQKIMGRAAPAYAYRGTTPSPVAAPNVDEAINPHKSLDAQAEEEYDEPEEVEGDIRADTAFDLGDWPRAAQPQVPPKKYMKQAKKIYRDFGIPVKAQAVEILAWELYRASVQAPTEPVKTPWHKKMLNVFKEGHQGSGLELLRLLRKVLKTAEGPYALEQAMIQGLSPEEQEQLKRSLEAIAETAQEYEGEQVRFAESKIERYIKEELEAYLEEEEKNNPWAICTASVGREDKEKYEKCVKSVKAKNRGK